MKAIVSLLILIVAGCSHPVVNPTSLAVTDTVVRRNFVSRDIHLDSAVAFENSFDSANFHVSLYHYVSGAMYSAEYIDTVTGIKDLKEYYENGQLKEAGKLTEENSIRIGTWNFFGENGRVDSVVNYDTRHRVSYFMALEIADKKGYKKPGMEISQVTEHKKTYWRVDQWKDMEGGGGEVSKSILINAESGEVSKPEYHMGIRVN